jgi:hypothetical protein
MAGKLYGNASPHAFRDQKIYLLLLSCMNSPEVQAFS